MTKEEVLQKLKTDLEVRGRSAATIREYVSKTRLYQDYHGKPADVMGEAEILEYLNTTLPESTRHALIEQVSRLKIEQCSRCIMSMNSPD